MTDNKKLNKELILKNPNLSGNELYKESKSLGIGIRKKDFYVIVREVRNLSEPTIAKKEASIPTKFKTTAQKVRVAKRKAVKTQKVRVAKRKAVKIPRKPPKLPFDETKFGKIVRDLEKVRSISEKKAIIHARRLLKIDKSDYGKINQKDVQILLAHTP